MKLSMDVEYQANLCKPLVISYQLILTGVTALDFTEKSCRHFSPQKYPPQKKKTNKKTCKSHSSAENPFEVNISSDLNESFRDIPLYCTMVHKNGQKSVPRI